MKYNYIVIEGCIGAGKTTLSEMLAQEFNAELILERFADNSFLPKFYKDPLHYAFPLEMTFLTERYQQLKNLLSKRDLFTDLVIADYFIDKCIVFSKYNLQSDEYNLYTKVYNIISTYLPKPDLILYLYNDEQKLLQNIAQRGREYEREISVEYLKNIQEGYMMHFKHYKEAPIVIVEAHNLDFVKYRSDYEKLKKILDYDYATGITRIIY